MKTKKESLENLELFKKWKSGEMKEKPSLSSSNLSGSNLRSSDLSYSNLSGSDLRGSDFSHSNLRGSDFSHSSLRGSDFSHSNLSGSDLDYSAWPLWCGTAHSSIKVCDKIAAQLLYHALIVTSPKNKKLITKEIMEFIEENFHRYEECEKLRM